jgi:cytochrome c oxidase accessory protein FixG
VACPYGRIQSVIMDEASLVVAYDKERGEPRRTTVPKEQEGDCIACDHCVKVCPTGIDIRKGTQLECISCTQCIDACDEIMTKMQRPTGLIRYDSLSNMEGKKTNFFRVRPMFYAIALLVTALAFTYALNKRNSISLQFIRGSKSAYQSIKRDDGEQEIVNHYKVSVYYNGSENHNLLITPLEHFESDQLRIVSQKMPFPVTPGKRQTIDIFFRFQKNILDNGRRTIRLQVKSDTKVLDEEEVQLVGPF